MAENANALASFRARLGWFAGFLVLVTALWWVGRNDIGALLAGNVGGAWDPATGHLRPWFLAEALLTVCLAIPVFFVGAAAFRRHASLQTVRNLGFGGILIALLVFGLGVGAWPEELELLPSNQLVIGVLISSLALFGLVTYFRNADFLKKELGEQRRLVSYLTLLIGFSVALAMAWQWADLKGMAMMASIIFLTILLAMNIMDGRNTITHDQVRTAITVSMVAAFFAILGFGGQTRLEEGTMLARAFDRFDWIVVAVIGLYFGSETLERTIARRRGEAAAEPAKPQA